MIFDENKIYDFCNLKRKKNNMKYLSYQEQEVLDLLIEAWNKYLDLPVQHNDDNNEFEKGIHQCQQIIALRVARKAEPEIFYNIEDKNKDSIDIINFNK